MKEISKKGIDLLLKNGIIKNTHRGFVNPKRTDDDGCQMKVGYYPAMKGRHRYIEDWYANMAAKLEEGKAINAYRRRNKDNKEKRRNG